MEAGTLKTEPAKEAAEEVPLWSTELANEVQQVVDHIFKQDTSGQIHGCEFSLTIADPQLEDCPLVGCSSGFTKLCGYGIDEIVGRNCRFLVDPVPAEYQNSAARRKAHAFCNPVTRDAHVPEDDGKYEWLPHGHRANLDGIFCAQVNARKDNTLFSNMFYMKHIMLDNKVLIIGLQTELPCPPIELKYASAKSEEVFIAACLLLDKNFAEVERVLARMFWLSAEMRRQDYGKDYSDTDNSTCGSSHDGLRESASPRSITSDSSASDLSCCIIDADATKTDPISEADLEATLESLSQGVKLWPEDHVTFIKTLQLAPRNHGEVNLVEFDAMEFDGESYGSVMQVAVKKLPNKWMRSNAKEFEEKYPRSSEQPWLDLAFIRTLQSLSFPHVCRLMGIFRDKKHSYVALQLCEEGDLFDWTNRELHQGTDRDVAMRPLVQQICSAIRFVHIVGIVHRDISLENILLTRDAGGELQVKIIDFGTATLKRFHVNELRGKPSYAAPEMHSDSEPYDAYLTDVFMLGVVFFAMLTGDYPWTSTKTGACKLFEFYRANGLEVLLQHRKWRLDNSKKIAEVMTQPFLELVVAMLTQKPSERVALAEPCWKESRRSVWDMGWLQQESPPTPSMLRRPTLREEPYGKASASDAA